MEMRRFLIRFAVAFSAVAALMHISAVGAAIVPSYGIQVRLDTEKHVLLGEESISFTNTSGKDLDKIYLHLYPNRFMDDQSIYAREKGIDGYDSIFPDGPDSGYTFIEELELNGAAHDYTIDDTIMRIDLEKPLSPGASLELYIRFRVKIPHAILRFGYDKGNYYISWWYPRLVAYDGQGWHPYQAHGTSPDEPYDNFAKYQVKITVSQGIVVGATGVQESATQNPDGTGTLTYTAENVHDFAWVADRRYKVETVSWEGVTIHSLYFPEDEAAGKRAAQYAKDALAYFSERYGEYPYKDFTVAETRMAGGAMEYPQLIMVTYMLYRLPKFLTLFDEVIAHETSHQWFYGMLMNDQTNEAWLDEGFATFSEVSYIEHKYGKEGNMVNLKEFQKLPLIGPILAGGIPNSREQMVMEPYLAAAQLGTEVPLLTPRNEIKPGCQPLVYQRGALTLFALQYLVGQETFDKIIQTYVKRYQFKHVTTQDFIKVAEEVSGQDLKWFFDGWLRSSKRLDYVLESVSTHNIGSKFITRVAIRNDGGLQMPVDVQVSLKQRKGEKEAGKITKRFWPLDRRGTLEFITDQPVESVVIDPEKLLPDLDRSNNELVPPISTSPLIEHGAMRGYKEDGLLLGVSFSSPDARISGQLTYATGSHKPLYNLSLLSSPWAEAGRLAKLGSALSLGFNLEDDGHILSADMRAVYNLSTWTSDIIKCFSSLVIQPFYKDLYDVTGDQGRMSGLKLGDRLALTSKEGWKASLGLGYKGALAVLGSDFPFNRYSLDLRLEKRISWRTHLNARLSVGLLQGRTPNGEEKFNIRRDGGFRTFERDDDLMAAMNLSIDAPIPQLNRLDLGPIPLSFGLIIFSDWGWFSHGLTTRAEVGWGLTFGLYGLEGLLRLEQVFWTNTDADGGRPGFNIGISLET